MDPIVKLAETIPLIITPDKSSLELECRFNIDERRIGKQHGRRFSPAETVRLAKHIIAKSISSNYTCEIEQSINFIHSNKGIKQMMFIDGVQQKDKHNHYHKEKIINPINVLDAPVYRIALSFEHPIEEFSIKECEMARIRIRFSITIGNWRYDITLVRVLNSLTNADELKEDKSKMLYRVSIGDYVDRAPWDFAHHVEFEVEYIGDMSKFKVEEFKHVSDFIKQNIDAINFDTHAVTAKHPNRNNTSNIDTEYQSTLYDIAKEIRPNDASKFKSMRYGIKQLSNQVIETNKNKFTNDILPDIENFYVTDKTDGLRTIVMIKDGVIKAVNNKVTTLGKFDKTSTYIFDAEFYNDKYYIFDVMVWNGVNLVNDSFEKRMTYFEKATKLTKEIHIVEKPFIRLTRNYAAQIKSLHQSKKPYDVDGIVLTPSSGMYFSMVVYKVKPTNKLSVDFLIKKCPPQLLNIKPYMPNGKNLYLLFCGVSKRVFLKLRMEFVSSYREIFPNINKHNLPDYFPVQFEPSDRRFAYLLWDDDSELDGKIGEFIIENPTAPHTDFRWKRINIRTDRDVELARGNYFGNNYKIAEFIWMNYQNPLDIVNDDFSDRGYFQKHDSYLHVASRSFNSFVKAQIFQQFQGTETVMDMASGKGQDLFRYSDNSMKNVLFIEIDRNALAELIDRKHDFSNDKRQNTMHIMVQQMDLNLPYKDNIDKLAKSNLKIPNSGFQLIVCNLAFHYLIGGKTFVSNIIKFVSHYLQPKGRFIFTAFDGEEVLALLNENKGEWKSSKPNKFHIKKEFKEDILNPLGQQISVLLPFSDNKYYTEYLVNINYLEREFIKHDMVLETAQSFGEYQMLFEKLNKKMYNMMDDDDKLYTSLYHYYGFYKKPPTEKKGSRGK